MQTRSGGLLSESGVGTEDEEMKLSKISTASQEPRLSRNSRPYETGSIGAAGG